MRRSVTRRIVIFSNVSLETAFTVMSKSPELHLLFVLLVSENAQRVLRGAYAHLDIGLGRHPPNMRTQHDAGLVVENVRRCHRFDGKTVKTGGKNLS